jgi:predicted DNA-binding protein
MTKTIHLSETTYNKLRESITGRIDHFVNKAIEKAIEEKSTKDLARKHLEKQLKVDYQRIAQNENIQKELNILSKMSLKDIYGKRKRK